MSRNLVFHRAAEDFLDSLPKKLQAQIVRKIVALADHPYPAGCKKLIGITEGINVWRIRSGDYRILYTISEKEIIISNIDNRKDVYRGY